MQGTLKYLTDLGYKFQYIGKGVIEVQTRHTNHLNDLIIIYIVTPDTESTSYSITDDGYTLSEFDLMGVSVKDNEEYLQSIAEEFSVNIGTDEIQVSSDKKGLLDGVTRVIKAIQKTDKILINQRGKDLDDKEKQ